MKILLFILIGLIMIPVGILSSVLLLAVIVGAAAFYTVLFIYNILTGKI